MGTATLLRVFLPFAAGYFLSYLFRVVNAVLAPDLAADIGVGPSALGLLTSVYFITFASFQLPLGILLDRYGPRKTEAALLMFAGLVLYGLSAWTLVPLLTLILMETPQVGSKYMGSAGGLSDDDGLLSGTFDIDGGVYPYHVRIFFVFVDIDRRGVRQFLAQFTGKLFTYYL